jgi:hypothetical protein
MKSQIPIPSHAKLGISRSTDNLDEQCLPLGRSPSVVAGAGPRRSFASPGCPANRSLQPRP